MMSRSRLIALFDFAFVNVAPVISALVFVVAVVAMVGCSVDVPDADRFISDRCQWRVPVIDAERDFTIAAVLPFKIGGHTKDIDALARSRAMQLAIEDANKRQGVAGRKFAFRTCDKSGNWVAGGAKKASHIAKWLSESGTHAVITGGSNDTLAVHAGTSVYKTLVMSLTATAADITHLTDDGLVWRVAPSDLYQGVVMSKVLSEQGATSVAAIVVDNAYGDSLAKILKDYPGTMTIKSYPVSATVDTPTKVIDLVAAQKPDYIVLASSVGAAIKVVDALAEHPTLSKVPVLLSDALRKKDFFNGLKNPDQLVGSLGTLPGDPSGPTFDAFATHFKLNFNDDATQRSFTAHSYDAAYALILAHAWALRDDKNKKLSGADLVEGLQKLSDPNGTKYTLESTNYVAATSELLAAKAINIDGASGPLDFDPDSGEPTSAVEIWQVEKGASFKTLRWIRALKDGTGWTYEEMLPK
jgi:branched-chain amino acid transport system substrate-binding protein